MNFDGRAAIRVPAERFGDLKQVPGDLDQVAAILAWPPIQIRICSSFYWNICGNGIMGSRKENKQPISTY